MNNGERVAGYLLRCLAAVSKPEYICRQEKNCK